MRACFTAMTYRKSSLPQVGCSRRSVLQALGAATVLVGCGSGSSLMSATSTACGGTSVCIDLTDPANAERLAAKLRGGGYGKIFVRDDFIAGRRMYRVRIGPVPGVPEFARIVAALEQAGVHDAHLALD